jgi:uncharacterized membrane protein YphA (DoxX/SURF4 family)
MSTSASGLDAAIPDPPRTALGAPGSAAIFLARLLLCVPFIISGIAKLIDFGGATAEVRGLSGLEPASLFAALVILTQLGGSAAILAGGRLAWLGAAALAGFTLLATVMAHAFWNKTGVDQARDFNTFWEHMGLIGGLALAALITPRTRP